MRQRRAQDRRAASFVAIDFETANYYRDSACALGLVVVDRGRVRMARSWMINPETSWFNLVHVHGIRRRDVVDAPTFGDLWPEVQPLLRGHIVAAHNAHFDMQVLRECCYAYGIRLRLPPAICTMRLAGEALGIWPRDLDRVCRRLRIPLDHHDPLSDARACARIVNRATRAIGWRRAQRLGSISL